MRERSGEAELFVDAIEAARRWWVDLATVGNDADAEPVSTEAAPEFTWADVEGASSAVADSGGVFVSESTAVSLKEWRFRSVHWVVGDVGVVITGVFGPLNLVHKPVPITGVLPASVTVVPH